jgi:hypothetical protein
MSLELNSLTNSQVTEYFQRSYRAVDGLWFMKVEEKYGFEAALGIDKEVWKVLPKIQARMIKSILKKCDSETTFLNSLKVKLSLEGFKFEVKQSEKGFRIIVSDCPWHTLMVKSGREELSRLVGTTICNIEYSVWISEFDKKLQFIFSKQKCHGSKQCVLNFKDS